MSQLKTEPRWTVLVVPHGPGKSKSLDVSRPVLRIILGSALAVPLTALVLGYTTISKSVDIARLVEELSGGGAVQHHMPPAPGAMNAVHRRLIGLPRRTGRLARGKQRTGVGRWMLVPGVRILPSVLLS